MEYLRSGQEHRQLQHSPCQIEVVEKPGERAYLLYTEEISKNNQGGIKGRKVIPKTVKHYANEGNPMRNVLHVTCMLHARDMHIA